MSDPGDPRSDLLFELAFGYDRGLPLEIERRTLRSSETLSVERFEFTSRNDQRVPGLLLSDPRRDGPQPLILAAHPGTLDKGSDYVLWPAQQWVARGAICATIDQAGHGERARRPVTMDDFLNYPLRRLDQTLQTAVDWMRALDWLAALPEIDPERIGFVGFSMGGMRGAPFVGLDARVRAAAFCISAAAARGGSGEAPTNPIDRLAARLSDPGVYAPMTAGRPILVVAGERDDLVTPEAVQRFYELLPEPREIVWLPCGHWDFMPQGIEPVGPFLERSLGFGGA